MISADGFVSAFRHSRVSMRRALLGTALANAAMIAAASCYPAHAQTATPQSVQAGPAQAAQTPAVEEVVITGTAIIRNGYQAPTPVTVLGTEEIAKDAPINI